jgi:hypothetical protein
MGVGTKVMKRGRGQRSKRRGLHEVLERVMGEPIEEV